MVVPGIGFEQDHRAMMYAHLVAKISRRHRRRRRIPPVQKPRRNPHRCFFDAVLTCHGSISALGVGVVMRKGVNQRVMAGDTFDRQRAKKLGRKADCRCRCFFAQTRASLRFMRKSPPDRPDRPRRTPSTKFIGPTGAASPLAGSVRYSRQLDHLSGPWVKESKPI